MKYILLLCAIIPFLCIGCSQTQFKGPGQPGSGPGGADYPHSLISFQRYGKKQYQYFIFIPRKPDAQQSPVILFLHGWGAMSPYRYGAWIRHLVLRGNIVIYPRMQSSVFTDNEGLTHTSLHAVKHAFGMIKENKLPADTSRFAVVGHSAGGNVAINIAARAKEQGLPAVNAVMCAQPGLEYSPDGEEWTLLEDLTRVPKETLLLIVPGDRDESVKQIDAKKIFTRTTNIPKVDKGYIMLVSDNYGQPALDASHMCPQAPDSGFDLSLRGGDTARYGDIPASRVTYPTKHVNALDYYGLWKLFDGLYDAAFHNRNRTYALGNTPEQRFMGTWEDGTQVKRLRVLPGPKNNGLTK